MILSAIRKSKRVVRFITSFMVINLLIELVAPLQAFALTGGPSQPEVQSFEPVSANQMVDPFTGDFTYNIPLLDVGGYPINISYHAGPGLDEEASWVGLGWNINPGVINRNMRGIPDDFDGSDKIKKTLHMKNNVEVELRYKRSKELFGLDKGMFKNIGTPVYGGVGWALGLGIKYNNYRGFGYNLLTGLDLQSKKGKGPYGLGLGLDFDSQQGADFDVSLDYGYKGNYIKANKISGGSVSSGVNSRQGMKSLSLGASVGIAYNSRKAKKSNIKNVKGAVPITFNSPSYTPSSSPDYNSLALSVDITFGQYMQGIHPKNTVGLSFSINGIKHNGDAIEYPAYGFLYNNKAWETIEKKEKALMDFNRDGGNHLNKFTKYLATANNTYDVLSVSGQGISGVYRPFYSTVGMVSDPYSRSFLNPSIGAGQEFGLPNTVKLGLDVNASLMLSSSGGWDKDNDAYQYVSFANTASNIDFEPAYYKNAGEKVKNDMDFYNKIGEYNAVAIELEKRFAETRVTDNAHTDANGGMDYALTTGWKRQKREKRNQVISYLTFDEAMSYGLIYNSTQDFSSFYNPAIHKGHHIGEYAVTNPDGSRYVYGLPAYNIKQKEVTFNISENRTDNHSACNGLVQYNQGYHESAGIGNTGGVDHFYSAEEIPPYAHSYLLSAILSPDYIDVNGDGPTEDDMGNYTFIKYKRVHSNYKWRTPYTEDINYANLQRGFESDNLDDKASYIYGEKEIWYIDKIVTKTHVAVFHTSARRDAIEAQYEAGGKDAINGKHLHKLDKIELFTLEDYNLHGTEATPVKVVYFFYDYALCKGIKNFDRSSLDTASGKLTLREIRFSYGKSSQAYLSPYNFNYNENILSDNPKYFEKAYDRWGNYKPNTCSPGNDEYPYTLQDDRENKSDKYAAAWSLREIILPSGGKIKVDYEADDYAYVQDKKAMEMIKVIGAASTPSDPIAQNLYDGNDDHEYLFFNYRENVAGSYTTDSIKKYYWNGDKYMYYSFSVDLKGGNYEQVNGYAEVEDFGIRSTVDKIAWVKIKEVPMNDRNNASATVQPISKMAWQYARLNVPHLVYPGSDFSRSVKLADLLFFGPELYKMVVGYERVCRQGNRGTDFNSTKSWIRLVSPEAKKIGGGYRVKMVRLIDNWHQLTQNATSEEDATIGQIYSYEKYDKESGRMISSGVASYEPLIGGDENPHRYPNNGLELQRSNYFTPLNVISHDIPVGETIYSSASVGYSRVVVRSIKPEDLGISNQEITRHGTGYTEQEFYTAKEFPVITQKTAIDVDVKRKPLLKLIGFSFERASGSQGFSIELNDMHGKMKSQFVYDENGNKQSGVEYFYKVENEKTPTYRLDNKVDILTKNGTIEEDATLGVEMEMVVDPQQKNEKLHAASFKTNMDGITFPLPPFIPIFSFFLNYSYHSTKIRTITTTKIINRYALVDRVVAYDQDATITTRNLAWDGETGEVLLTKTENEHNDNIYNMTYPAHWVYDGMGHAYKNIGLSFSMKSIPGNTNISPIVSGSGVVSNEIGELMQPGDELMVKSFNYLTTPPSVTPTKVWVLDKIKNAGNYTLSFIQRDGTKAPDGEYTFKVLRSGRRNMQSTPVASVVSKDNPLDITNHLFGRKTDFDSVINASAVKFSNQWQTYSLDPGCWIRECYYSSTTYPTHNGSCEQSAGWSGYNPRNMYEFLFLGNTLVPYGIISPVIFPNERKLFPKETDFINPYVWGIRGSWRPEQSYVYFDRSNANNARSQTTGGAGFNSTYTRTDGLITNFEPFWLSNSGNDWVETSANPNPWTWNTKVTQISPDGYEVENKDALGIYSAAQYSYINKLPVAVANNARLNDIVFENFEDYGDDAHAYLSCPEFPITATPNTSVIKNSYEMTKVASSPMHWYLWPDLKEPYPYPAFDARVAYVVNTKSHTGFRSLLVQNDTVNIPVHTNPTNTTFNTGFLAQYKAEQKDFVSVFGPTATTTQNEYILSYWEKKGNTTGGLELYVPATSSTITLTQIGVDNLVEGWVRKEFKFTIPTSVSYFEVKIFNSLRGGDDEPSYFDDIRIFPIKGNMKSFVYDNTNLRLMAELDENNYATLFEYDEEGNLIRTKKETERGIITLSENRENIKK